MNSSEFKNFKLHADSTLKSMKKDELISYIHTLHHNWGTTDERLCNAIICNNKINDALDRMIDARDFIDDCPPESCPTRKRCTSMREEDCHKCWKEWCMKGAGRVTDMAKRYLARMSDFNIKEN